jgi:hypothetical protein
MNNFTKVFYFLLAFAVTLIIHPTRAASLPMAVQNKFTVNDPVPSKQALKVAQMKAFTSLSVEQYGQLRGRKLNFFERQSFLISQHRMKKMLQHYDYGDVTTLQKISWLLKGLLLGPIAVALAYIFLHDEETELIKWTWFGFAGMAVAVGLILLLM